MPRYDYDCAACGQRFEVMHGVHGEPPATCPLCGSWPVRKAISAPTVHFKGSGWAKKERHASAKSASSSKGGEDGSAESGSNDPGPADADPKDAGSKDAGSKDTGSTVSEPAAAKATTSSHDGSSTSKPTSKTPAAAAD